MKKRIDTYLVNRNTWNKSQSPPKMALSNQEVFALRREYSISDTNNADRLWAILKDISKDALYNESDCILYCESDVIFSEAFSGELFEGIIKKGKTLNAELVIFGACWLLNAFPAGENLFWVDKCDDLHFAIFYKPLLAKIYKTSTYQGNNVYYFLSELTSRKFIAHPYITKPKENLHICSHLNISSKQDIHDLYLKSSQRLQYISEIYHHFSESNATIDKKSDAIIPEIQIPVYVMNLPERTERKSHIINEFSKREEFELNFIEACRHEIGALGHWLSIRKIVEAAVTKEEDVIIICEDDHIFTPEYKKEYLIKNIVEAYLSNTDFLLGGVSKADMITPISENRYWVRFFLSTQFVIVYKRFFDKILNEPFDEKIVADVRLSCMSNNKAVLYPFISTQKDFGYSDITAIHNSEKDLVSSMFQESELAFSRVHSAAQLYSLK
ncbi:hypothetical protein [Niabella sp.]|uniref:hypothetical protein n=1 Tax=Niabella sp. TaxID=1962976 RepID=UPI00261411B6|nr:hypothetical protein [Niabella sp.]